MRELVPPLLVYSEGGARALSGLLAHLQHISCFASHCRDVVANLVQQLAVLLDPKYLPPILGDLLPVQAAAGVPALPRPGPGLGGPLLPPHGHGQAGCRGQSGKSGDG